MLKYLLLAALFIGQTKEQIVVPYRDNKFTYYTITSQMAGGWAMTGYESNKTGSYPGIRWLTAAHYFPVSMKSEVMPTVLNGETLYINEVALLGSDVCIFRLGTDSTFVVKGFSPRGPKDSYNAQMDISLFDEPDRAIYLANRLHYPVIGSITVHDPFGDIEGFLIDKDSKPGDCGTAFLYDGALCIITKGLPAGMALPDGRILGGMTLVVRLELTP